MGADGKDAIALRDEVVELKKSLNSVTRERDLTQARYAKLEQALAKKDKEIEDLLASGHITVSSAHEYPVKPGLHTVQGVHPTPIKKSQIFICYDCIIGVKCISLLQEKVLHTCNRHIYVSTCTLKCIKAQAQMLVSCYMHVYTHDLF